MPKKQMLIRFNQLINDIIFQNDQTPHWIKIFSMLLQFITILLIINLELKEYEILFSKIFSVLFQSPQYTNIVLVILTLVLIINLVFQISFFKSYYLMILHLSFSWTIIQKIVVYVLLSIGLLIEIISNTENSFYTQNILSQNNNYLKICHFLANILIVNLRYFIPNQLFFAICVFTLYTIILILRIVNKMNHIFIKTFLEFTYMLMISCGALNFFIQIFKFMISKQQFFILIFVSGIFIYKIKKLIYNENLRAEKIQTDKQLIETIREIITYLYTNKYSIETKNVIQEYIQLNKNQLNLPNTFKLDIDSEELFLLKLSEILNNYIQQDNFTHLLLKAEIQFKINKNYYTTMKLIRSLQNTLSIRNILNRILVRKLKNQIHNEINLPHNFYQPSVYQLILQNDRFVEKIYQGAMNYKNLWMPITESQVIVENIENVLISVLNCNYQIEQQYKNLQLKNKHSIMLYFYYAFMVERKKFKAIKLFNQNQFFIQDIRCNNQLYLIIQINLENGSLGQIEKISPNIEGKLGYQPKQLQNQNLKILVPEFFRKMHEQKLEETLNKMDIGNMMQDYKKTTFCENIHKQLKQIQLNLRLLYHKEEDKLIALGYLKIMENSSNFIIVFLKESGNILYMPDINHKLNLIQYSKTSYQEILATLEKNKQIQLQITDHEDFFHEDNSNFTFNLYKQLEYNNKSNIIILKYKEQTDVSQILHRDKEKKQGFVKYRLNKQSSISNFFVQKKKIHKEQFNNSTLIIRITILLLFTLIILGIIIYFINLNGIKTQKKLQLVQWGQNIYLQQLNIYRLLIWNYYLYFSQQGINFPFLDYTQSSIKQFLPILYINNYELLTMGQDTLIQNTVHGTQHTIKVYDLIQSLQSSMSYINSNYNNDKIFIQNMINQARHYIFQNEKAVTTGCMPAWANRYEDVTQQIKGNYDMFYQFCTVIQSVFTVALSIFIILFEREQSRKYSQVITVISDIKNQDRFQIIESIRLFLEKITCSSNPKDFYHQIIKNIYSNKRSRKESHLQKMDNMLSHNSLIGSPNNQSSQIGGSENNTTHRLFYRSSIISTPRVQINKSISDALDDIVHKSQKLSLKQKPIKLFLIIKVTIGLLSFVFISTYNYLYTKSPDYLTSSYIYNIFIQKDKAIIYQQKIQYFLRAIKDNFTSLEDFASIYQKESDFNKQGHNFKILLTQFSEFAEFNQFYNQFQYKTICSFLNCTLYSTLLNNTLQTISLFNSGYLQQLMNQSSAYPNSLSLLQDPGIIFAIYTQQLFAEIQLKLFSLYFKCLRVYTNKIQKTVDNYLYILIGFTGGYFLMITMPQIYNLVKKKKMMGEFLDILDEDIYRDFQ